MHLLCRAQQSSCSKELGSVKRIYLNREKYFQKSVLRASRGSTGTLGGRSSGRASPPSTRCSRNWCAQTLTRLHQRRGAVTSAVRVFPAKLWNCQRRRQCRHITTTTTTTTTTTWSNTACFAQDPHIPRLSISTGVKKTQDDDDGSSYSQNLYSEHTDSAALDSDDIVDESPCLVSRVEDACTVQVYGMACVGFLWSVSTMMVFSLLPVFLRVELGASNLSIGLLEGAATALNTLAKVVSGIASDRSRNRARVIQIGSILTVLVKFIFALSTSVGHIFIAKCVDRLAKGIRMAPTDALLADLSPPEKRSRTYGLYSSMMTLGAVLGAFCASSVMTLSSQNFRLVFSVAAVPAVLASLLFQLMGSNPLCSLSPHHDPLPPLAPPSHPPPVSSPMSAYYRASELASFYSASSSSSSVLTYYAHDSFTSSATIPSGTIGSYQEINFVSSSHTAWVGHSHHRAPHRKDEEESLNASSRVSEVDYVEDISLARSRITHISMEVLKERSGESSDSFGTIENESLEIKEAALADTKSRLVQENVEVRTKKRRRTTTKKIETATTSGDGEDSRSSESSAESETERRSEPSVSSSSSSSSSSDPVYLYFSEWDLKLPLVWQKVKVMMSGVRLTVRQMLSMPRKFWITLLVFAVLMFARFSEAFVLLRARSLGVPLSSIPFFVVANSLTTAAAAYPIGCLCDATDRKTVLLVGFLVLGASHFVLASASTPAGILCGFMLAGLHMAMTQSPMKAVLSETIPPELRGTGFSMMAVVLGVALTGGNLLAGGLADAIGPAASFRGGFVAVLCTTVIGYVLL